MTSNPTSGSQGFGSEQACTSASASLEKQWAAKGFRADILVTSCRPMEG
jgi:hypothetical protein